jgi:hypothetical protein
MHAPLPLFYNLRDNRVFFPHHQDTEHVERYLSVAALSLAHLVWLNKTNLIQNS